jgi:aspartyl-tRNA(Asn)/glutamyl-tRNA(Gln) amidotransferase subunit A
MTMERQCDHVWQIADAVAHGELTAEAACEASLRAIAQNDPQVSAFITVSAERAREQARAIDQKRARGETLGRLAGVPIAVKDALVTRGVATTCGSKLLDGYVPPYDATVVSRLLAEDAVIVGKANMDEFAMGSSTEHSAFFPTKNPWDRARTPGGSSGGSAAAVAAGMVPAAIGSDTGGSVRQPASFTGTVGVKPTYGRVSRYGLVAFASSLDQVGPIASDVRGAARLLDVISGACEHDMTCLREPPTATEALAHGKVNGLRLGVPGEYFADGLSSEVRGSVDRALAALTEMGATLVPIAMPHTALAVATYYVIAPAEASSNLSRFDGVRFGARAKGRTSLGELISATRAEGFGAEVKRRILLGTFVLSSGYYDAYYGRALAARRLISKDFDEAFTSVDAVVSPVAPTAAWKLGELTDPMSMYLSDAYTIPASLAGLPALSVPVAPTPSGLPVGLHIVCRANDEGALLSIAAAVETRYPPCHPPRTAQGA